MRKFWPFRIFKRQTTSGKNLAEFAESPRGFGPPRLAEEASDRGPAKYFHGRGGILRDFAAIGRWAVKNRSGTIFLIQGAPGAGKTALLAECAKRAEAEGWRVVEIRPEALHDPAILMEDIGASYTSAQIRCTGGGLGTYAFGSVETHQPGHSVIALMHELSVGSGLLLVLDEAQILADYGQAIDQAARRLKSTLQLIHNGKIGHPVMLLAGGLGTSRRVFESLGISRFRANCLVELGRLSGEAERAILRDWLTKYGKARGDPEPWIDAITKETYGWPQHIMSYVQPALEQLDESGPTMSAKELTVVLDRGSVLRATYYEGRVDDFEFEELRYLTQALTQGASGGSVPYASIMETLAR